MSLFDFDGATIKGVVFPQPDVNEVGKGLSKLFDLIDEALEHYADCSVTITGSENMSDDEVQSLKHFIEMHGQSAVVHYKPEVCVVKTHDGTSVSIFLVFGGKSINRKIYEENKPKKAAKAERESIGSLGSLGSLGAFTDITGQGMTQATDAFYGLYDSDTDEE